MQKKVILILFISSLNLFWSCNPTPATEVPVVYSEISGLKVIDGVMSNRIYIKWDLAPGALAYIVRCSTNTNTADILVTNLTAGEFRHTGLNPDSVYYYRVIVNYGTGSSLGTWVNGSTAPVLAPGPVGGTINTYNNILYTYDPAAFSKPSNELVIMTLNMHTYQESDQDAKFDTIAETIARLDADFVACQENAQHKNSSIVTNIGGVTIRNDNMALILQQRLKTYYGLDYYFAWAWAHYGWSVWEEGVAVLSRYPIVELTNFYVSSSSSIYDLSSRKLVYARAYVPVLDQNINFVSTHLYWKTSLMDLEPKNQVNNVKALIESKHGVNDLSIVCGDYNSQATETDLRWAETYLTMMTNGLYQDTFLEYHPTATNMPENSLFDTVKGSYPGRIDYIFMRTNSQYSVMSSQIIFTPTVLGTVSDHYGVVTRIQKN